MSRIPRRAEAPQRGVSSDLLETTIKLLRRKYGERALGHDFMHDLEYHLGAVERKYAETAAERHAREAEEERKFREDVAELRARQEAALTGNGTVHALPAKKPLAITHARD